MSYSPRPEIIWEQLVQLRDLVRERFTASPLGYTSISEGSLRILSSEGLIVVGTARTTGTQYVDGRLEGAGTFDWTGPMWLRGSIMLPGTLTGVGSLLWSGPWELRGAGDITGDVELDGDLSLGSGRFIAGPVTIDKLGPAGGRIASSGQMIVEGASGVRILGALTTSAITALGDVIVGDLFVTNLDVSGAKNFRMPHPTKPDHWLRHGSTESPVSGTEYTGRVTLDENGEAEVILPEYFEALNKARNRTVQVTPVGRPFAVGAEEVTDGKVTVYGEPGRDVFWLVKAERYGGDFPLEEQIPPELFSED